MAGRKTQANTQRNGESLRKSARQRGLQRQRRAKWLEQLLQPEPEESVQFHPVQLVGHEGSGQECQHEPIEIVLADGVRVRVPMGFSAEELGRVLSVLEGVSVC
jgi:hypothetical protein